jgi:CRP-like cAMP-binding protein
MKAEGVFRNADTTRDVPAGTVIFSRGDAGAEMFGVISGEIELLVGDEVIDKLGPDDIFGEMAIVDSSPRMATARALTDTTLAVINRRHFLFLVHETPMFALQVMSAMAERIRRDH